MSTRRFVAASLLAVTAAAVALAGGASAATSMTPSAYASRIAYLTNQARQQHGLRPLTLASGTTVVAAGWSQHMAGAEALSHNPSLQSQLESHGSANWGQYAENVGRGAKADPDSLFTAYMNSPEHRTNILDPGNHFLGISAVFGSDGYAYNTMDFVDVYSGGTATVAAPAPAPKRLPIARPAAVAPRPRPVAHPAPRRLRHIVLHYTDGPTVKAVAHGRSGGASVEARPVTAALVVPAAHDARWLAVAVAALLVVLVGGAAVRELALTRPATA